MSSRPAGAVVVDTMAVSALVNATRNPALAAAYRQVIDADRIVVCFATVTDLRYGALRAGWGQLRRRGLERDLAQFVIVQPDDQLMRTCAELRASCERADYGLGHKIHEADRWIAATALRLKVHLVSDDAVFRGIPGPDRTDPTDAVSAAHVDGLAMTRSAATAKPSEAPTRIGITERSGVRQLVIFRRRRPPPHAGYRRGFGAVRSRSSPAIADIRGRRTTVSPKVLIIPRATAMWLPGSAQTYSPATELHRAARRFWRQDVCHRRSWQ